MTQVNITNASIKLTTTSTDNSSATTTSNITPSPPLKGHAQSTAVRHSEYSNHRAEEFHVYKNKYPNWEGPYIQKPIQPTMTFTEYHNTYSHIEKGSRLEEETPITLCARIQTRRNASSKLTFLDIAARGDNILELSKLQCIISSQRLSAEVNELSQILRRGDWVAITGIPGKSKTGELSIVATQVQLLTPCLDALPEKIEDPNIRFRTRSTDLVVNEKPVWDIFRTRITTIRALRTFLHDHGFSEVETPILWPRAGGASARPFITTSNAFSDDLPLSLRVAPELFLKQLIMGGMERVFEIGKVFRNEGIDATHSPEFTSCEFYMAHANVDTLYTFTEDLFRSIVKTVNTQKNNSTLCVTIPAKNRHDPEAIAANHECDDLVIDFSKPFQKLDVLETFKNHGIILPSNFNEDEAIPELLQICRDHGYLVKSPITVPRILDKLVGEIIEPLCIQPTFIINHPTALCPLAKEFNDNSGTSERFELFINCKEYVNAYSELNIPKEQYQRFANQQATQKSADILREMDDEAHPVDTPYCESMQVGLPPTGGWGLGLDRLVMLLSGVPHIRDVLLFPIMKPQN